jgi:N utilization substance protein A
MANFINTELGQIANSVAREKDIPKEAILEAIESAIEVASRKKYGNEHKIKAHVDIKTGEIAIFRVMDIVEDVENPLNQISLEDAQRIRPDAKYGEQIMEQLPPLDLGRVTAQTAKQVIFHKIGAAERERQYNDFKDKVGEIINGTVKRIEFNNIIVEIGRNEAIIKNTSVIKSELFKRDDTIRAWVEEVTRTDKGPQIFLSRTHAQFLVKLFEQEVPEVYEGIIMIKSVARDPGSRAKVAVYSEDNSIDPIGSCVGVRGSRVQAIINELRGEKIDIIEWSSDPATYVINALTPAEIGKVVIDEEKRKIEVIVPADNLSIAIGRRGQNVRLASQLTGWNIDVLTEEQESKRRIEEFGIISQKFIQSLDVEEVIANLLTAEGFTSIEEIAYVALEDLANIEGFNEEIAVELQQRALTSIEALDKEHLSYLNKLGVEKDLAEKLGIPLKTMVNLAEAGYKSLEDISDARLSELKYEVKDIDLSDKALQKLINLSTQMLNEK